MLRYVFIKKKPLCGPLKKRVSVECGFKRDKVRNEVVLRIIGEERSLVETIKATKERKKIYC